MNFSKSKVLLKKINTIHDSAASDEGKLSSLEKDLIRQYLRELYECVADEDQMVTFKKSARHEPENSTEHKQDSVISEKMPFQQPQRIESLDKMSNGSSIPVLQETIELKQEKQSSKKELDPDLLALFISSESLDLSQRFANAPIKDISKAMGINERILTINELFKGDQKEFQEVVGKINAMSTFDNAKLFLIEGIASKNNWSSEKCRSKAEVFVKLVRRRFL